MHHRLLITISLPVDATSEDARSTVYNELVQDHSFCGDGGRFGSPLCDWFVIGGRWRGLLAEITLGAACKNEVRERFPELASSSWPQSFVDRHASDLDALWKAHGGTGPSPYTRSGYEELGFPDDAAIVSRVLYDELLARFVGESQCEGFTDLDDEEVRPDFVGRKWLVVIDYHN